VILNFGNIKEFLIYFRHIIFKPHSWQKQELRLLIQKRMFIAQDYTISPSYCSCTELVLSKNYTS